MTKDMQCVKYSASVDWLADQKITVKVEPYEAAKRRKNSKEIEKSKELPPDVPSVCVDGTVLDAVPTPVNVTLSRLIAKQSLT